MQPGFNRIVDAFWGSSGKGKLAASIADRYQVRYASSSNFPNAGHTVVMNGKKFVTHCLPAASACPSVEHVWLSANSGFWPETLMRERSEYPNIRQVSIHERAVVMQEEYVTRENASATLQSLASTASGSGAAQVSRLMREPGITAASYLRPRHGRVLPPHSFATQVRGVIEEGAYWLHEVSQGFALGLLYGTHYPYCTSRECSASQAVVDMGLPPKLGATGDVYLNVRSVPIRVGNTKNGTSGPFLSRELTIEQVAERAGAPREIMRSLREIETTTCTKRPRRFSELCIPWVRHAAEVNGATLLALNFAQYIDWADHGVRDLNKLSRATRTIITELEEATNIPVAWVGTGREHEDAIWL